MVRKIFVFLLLIVFENNGFAGDCDKYKQNVNTDLIRAEQTVKIIRVLHPADDQDDERRRDRC